MKIDIFPHFLPVQYKEKLFEKANKQFFMHWGKTISSTQPLYDLDHRLRMIDNYDGLRQVLTLSAPPVEDVGDARTATYLSKLANDELAELVQKYPDKFIAAVACLPMNDMDAALKETDRAIKDLKFKGIQIFTPYLGKPLDSPELMPLYEKMQQYDLPIWIHPAKESFIPDYVGEERSKYSVYQFLAWPYETSVAMVRLVYSGVLEKYPRLKFITHHCGGMIPYLDQRILYGLAFVDKYIKISFRQALTKPPVDYYHMFYADTANAGSTPGLMCGHAFFGTEHMLFGTDTPYDGDGGNQLTKNTIKFIDLMDIPKHDKDMIFEGNARRLLHLDR